MEELGNYPLWENNRQFKLRDAGVFKENKYIPIHSWFSYTEGYSHQFVKEILKENPHSYHVVDPFTGSSTTGVETVLSGKFFQGYDINPVMKLIGEGKTHHSFRLARKIKRGDLTKNEINLLMKEVIDKNPEENYLINIFKGKHYYSRENLRQIFKIRSNIEAIEDEDLKIIFLLSLLSISVEVSNLKRSPDLKYRPKELWNTKKVKAEFEKRLMQIISDICGLEMYEIGRAKIYCASAESLKWTADGDVDLIITSPPYLNGTNYCRNTKLELWLSGLLQTDADLKNLRKASITCSINTAQNRKFEMFPIKEINKTIKAIERKAYDPRITPMVANYFHDMWRVTKSMYRVLRKDGVAYSVMGDSAFNNVHIPTHKHLERIAKEVGFSSTQEVFLRERRSRGGMKLCEVVQIFKK